MADERKPETRTLPKASAELRVSRSGEKPLIAGNAVVYNVLSEDLGGFREKIAPGAFARFLPGADIRALVNHNRDLVLGRTKSGTCRIVDSLSALAFEVDADTPIGATYAPSVERGDIDGCSFRFYVLTDSWSLENGVPIRTVHEADIDDVSIATYPAYAQTEAAVRSLERFRKHAPKRDLAYRRHRLALSS